MRRPRHREKSNLLWKMLGVAGVINLVLWPILIHEGVFAGVRQEVLIPVRLVSAPPPRKLPDALQKVARASLPAGPSAPPSVSPRPRPGVKSKLPVSPPLTTSKAVAPTRPLTLTPVAVKKIDHPTAPGHPPVTAQKSVPPASRQAVKMPPPTPHAAPQSAHVAQVTPAPSPPAPAQEAPQESTPDTTRVVQPELAARLARAKQLEAQGREVAEWIARQRATRVAALPPPTPSDSSALPPVPAVTPPPDQEEQTTPKVALTTIPRHEALSPSPKPHKLVHFVPPVVLRRDHPTVPDSMMKTAWHATFRGLFTVHPNGAATVQMVSSTGMPVLDRRAIAAARRWKFRPARLNGTAVTTSQAFSFEYDVHPVR